MYRIGGENLVATAFAQLMDLRKNSSEFLYLTEYQLDRYRWACQNYLDNKARDVYYEIYPDMKNFSFVTQPVKMKNYLITLPPLDIIASRNFHLFYTNGIDNAIFLMNRISDKYVEEQLQLLFPNDIIATHVLLNKVSIDEFLTKS